MIVRKNQNNRITFAEVLFYSTIFALPFEQLITIGGFSIIKWVGLIFMIVSLKEFFKFYRVVPMELWLFAGYISVSLYLDVIKIKMGIEQMNENIRPVLFFVLMLATYNLALIGRIRLMIVCLVLSSLLLVLFQVSGLWLETANLYQEAIGYEDRMSALGTDPNFTASFIALGVLANGLIAFNIVRCPPWIRLVSAAAASFGLLGIIKTSSRGGLLALACGVVAIVFTGKQWKKKIMALLAVGFILWVVMIMVTHSELFTLRIETYRLTGDSGGRDMIWEAAWQLIKQSPVIGYGYRYHMFTLGAATGKILRATHNTFIAVVLSAGFFGACLFALFFLRTGWSVWRCRQTFPGNILFCWFMICFGMSMTMNAEIAKWYWIVLSLCLGVKARQDRLRAERMVECGML